MIRRGITWLRRRLLLARDPVAYARSLGVSVGLDCRLLDLNPGAFGSEPYLISIGNHVTLTSGVKFVHMTGGCGYSGASTRKSTSSGASPFWITASSA